MKAGALLGCALASSMSASSCRSTPQRAPIAPAPTPMCARPRASQLADTPLDDTMTWRCAGRCCPATTPDGSIALELVSVIEPDLAWSHMLSGLWYDASRGAFLAVRDNEPAVVWMRPDAAFATWTGGDTGIALSPHGSIEAITGTVDGLVFGDEDERNATPPGPHLFRSAAIDAGVDAGAGELIAVPERFRRACENSGFESASASPDGHTLIAMTERALDGDAPGFVRVLLLALDSRTQRQRAYRLGPDCWGDDRPSELGASEVVAISDDHALVLERSYRRDAGNCARLYLADFSRGEAVTDVDRLTRETRAAPKRLVLDLSTLSRDVGLPPAATQTHPILGNYEGMALGPCMADGRRSVVLVTDDNDDSVRARGGPPQARRVLTLGARGL